MREQLPCNLESERYVLGSALIDPERFSIITAGLSAEDFSLEANRRIYGAMVAIIEAGNALDRVTLYEELRRRGQAESVGGLSYITSLDDGLPRLENLDSYIRIVQDKSLLRRTILSCDATIKRCMGGDSAPAVLAEAAAVLSRISDDSQRDRRLLSPAEIIRTASGGVSGFYQPHLRGAGIPSPWDQVNELIGGCWPGQLLILAARPKVGKSAAAAQWAMFAAQQGYGAVIYSLEMSAQEILVRLICSRSRVDSHKFQRGYLSREERGRFSAAATEIEKLPLWIDDRMGCTVPAIVGSLRKHMAQHEVRFVVVDYLQLMQSAGRHDSRVQEVSEITRSLKRGARDLGVPILALSQLSREAVKDGWPQLHHLRECGSIEQDADKVLFLHPRQITAGEIPPDVLDTKFIVGAQRGGSSGHVTLMFHRPHTRFDDPKAAQGAYEQRGMYDDAEAAAAVQ